MCLFELNKDITDLEYNRVLKKKHLMAIYLKKRMNIISRKGKDTLGWIGSGDVMILSYGDGRGRRHALNTLFLLAVTVMSAVKFQYFSINETIVQIMR